MRISFQVPGYIYDKNTDQLVEDPAGLSTFDGWRYDGDSMYDYLDMELVDQGVTGGFIRVIWTPDRGLEIVTDYWAPDTLQPSYVNQLRDETIGQLSDGMGEGGFQVTLNGRAFVIVADTDGAPVVEQAHDGKPVPMPSRIAQAARDGNTPLLVESIGSGEAIDSKIQGYSGLHLAIIYGRVEAALWLISKGANVDLLTTSGETPLHLCALANSLSDGDGATVATALLTHGADKSKKTPEGYTAASFAESRKKPALLDVLKGV
jgi:hypothetical protein